MRSQFTALAGAITFAAGTAGAQVFNGGLPAGYTCTAASTALGCGTSAANGSITLAPSGGTRFGWVSTNGGSVRNPLGIASTTNGSSLLSSTFTATVGQTLAFNFNYVTSDGTGSSGSFPDYAYVRLLGGGSPTLLFTASTALTGNTVPGAGLPGLAPGVTLTPGSTPIIPGAPRFDALGSDSNQCYGTGCGYTGWITALYTISVAGTYQLEFNVFNVRDLQFGSALAFDYSLGAGGTPTTPVPGVVPEPSTYALTATALAGLAGFARRRRRA